MANSLYRRWGATLFPVLTGDVSDTLAPLDPARDKFLEFFRDAINGELGEAWTVIVGGTGIPGASPVQTALPIRPSITMTRELVTSFPLLTVNREGTARFGNHSILRRQMTQDWGVNYILAPLDAADERRAGDVLQAVAKIVEHCLEENHHPNHNSGDPVFAPTDFKSMELTTCNFGQAKFAEGNDSPVYWAASMTLQTSELTGHRDGVATPLGGMSVSTGTGDESGILEDLVLGDSESYP